MTRIAIWATILSLACATVGHAAELQFDKGVTPADRSLVLKLLGPRLDDEIDPDRDVSIAKSDLNGDGRSDYVATINNPIACGTHGCTAAVFVSDGKGYRIAADLIVFGIDLGPGRTLGARDLVLQGQDGKARWAWNGTGYEPAGDVQ